jgi:hypothetical protein
MSTFRLVLVPGIITAAVTLLRLTGELNHWSRTFFNPDAGGGLALVGIAWLVPIFGIYFAMKFQSSGQAGSGWRTLGSPRSHRCVHRHRAAVPAVRPRSSQPGFAALP